MIFNCLKKFFEYFKEDRNSFIWYSIVSLFAGILELLGVALTYPFILKILSDQKEETEFLSPFFIGFVIILLFLLKNLFMIFYTKIQAKYTNYFEGKIKKQFMQHFLTADYNTISKISFTQKGKIFGLLIPNLMNNFILRLLNLNINVFIFVMISGLIAVKFPLATVISTVCAVLLITIQNHIYKPYLAKISENISNYALLYDKSFNEIVLNLKEIRISNNEIYFYEKFKKNQEIYLENRQKQTFLNLIPPYVTEPFVIILLFVLLSIISFQTYETPDKLVASFALIVSALFRLAPTISRIQVNINGINSALPLVKEFIAVYEKFDINKKNEIKNRVFSDFKNYIELKDVSFAYKEGKNVLENINLKIKKGEFVGITGLSGAGKTTLADIISGLYSNNTGDIIVDGEKINQPLKIGYIPQEFSLVSGNIRENVAFGKTEIDDKKVVDALKKAQLYDFIIENYKDGIYANPFVDSTGISLGQRQRIAIARALYYDPDILILDEATSSLDLKTEDEFCKVLSELKGKKTIIAITHKLATLKISDKIIFLENNTISQTGSFEDLLKSCENFNKLVKLAGIK